MVAREAVDYARQCAKDGYSDDAIKKALIDAGWSEADVGAALAAARGAPAEKRVEPAREARPAQATEAKHAEPAEAKHAAGLKPGFSFAALKQKIKAFVDKAVAWFKSLKWPGKAGVALIVLGVVVFIIALLVGCHNCVKAYWFPKLLDFW